MFQHCMIGVARYHVLEHSERSAYCLQLTSNASVAGFCLQVTLAMSKTTLSDADVFNLVASTITSGKHPADLNGVYFLLTSKDVAQGKARSNFCGSYCGWHTHGSVAGVGNIKYSWVGESGLCSVQAQWINPAVYLLAACSCFVC